MINLIDNYEDGMQVKLTSGTPYIRFYKIFKSLFLNPKISDSFIKACKEHERFRGENEQDIKDNWEKFIKYTLLRVDLSSTGNTAFYFHDLGPSHYNKFYDCKGSNDIIKYLDRTDSLSPNKKFTLQYVSDDETYPAMLGSVDLQGRGGISLRRQLFEFDIDNYKESDDPYNDIFNVYSDRFDWTCYILDKMKVAFMRNYKHIKNNIDKSLNEHTAYDHIKYFEMDDKTKNQHYNTIQHIFNKIFKEIPESKNLSSSNQNNIINILADENNNNKLYPEVYNVFNTIKEFSDCNKELVSVKTIKEYDKYNHILITCKDKNGKDLCEFKIHDPHYSWADRVEINGFGINPKDNNFSIGEYTEFRVFDEINKKLQQELNNIKSQNLEKKKHEQQIYEGYSKEGVNNTSRIKNKKDKIIAKIFVDFINNGAFKDESLMQVHQSLYEPETDFEKTIKDKILNTSYISADTRKMLEEYLNNNNISLSKQEQKQPAEQKRRSFSLSNVSEKKKSQDLEKKKQEQQIYEGYSKEGVNNTSRILNKKDEIIKNILIDFTNNGAFQYKEVSQVFDSLFNPKTNLYRTIKKDILPTKYISEGTRKMLKEYLKNNISLSKQEQKQPVQQKRRRFSLSNLFEKKKLPLPHKRRYNFSDTKSFVNILKKQQGNSSYSREY